MDKVVARVDKYVDQLESLVRPYIAQALRHAHGETTVDAIIQQIRESRAQLWTVSDADTKRLEAVCVTEVTAYRNVRTVRVLTLAGSGMEHWVRPLDDRLQAFARQVKATRIEAVGRKGLRRVLEELAFIPAYVVYLKEVEYGEDRRKDGNGIPNECPEFSATVC